MMAEDRISDMVQVLQDQEIKLEKLQILLQVEKQSRLDLLSDYEHIVNIVLNLTDNSTLQV